MGPTDLTILLLVGLTSGAACLLGSLGLRLDPRRLWSAVGQVLEALGIVVVFLGVNLGGGALAILAFRTLSGQFVSVYTLDDVTVVILALLQGLVFQSWRARSSSSRSSSAPRRGP
jgi:hypothetical protein